MESTDQQTITRILVDCLESEVLPSEESITPETNLEESGLDSLGLTQLLLRVEEETGFWLDEEHLTPENLETVGSLSACIHDQISRG